MPGPGRWDRTAGAYAPDPAEAAARARVGGLAPDVRAGRADRRRSAVGRRHEPAAASMSLRTLFHATSGAVPFSTVVSALPMAVLMIPHCGP